MTDLLRLMRERYQTGVDGDTYNRDRDMEDRTFYKGGDDQWDSSALTERTGRPTITINRMSQFVKQVTGEMRQNKPAIKVLPVDDKTDPKLAELMSAIIRHIESHSDAHRVYSKAGEQAVIGGIGWFRVLTDFLGDASFEQEILVEGIKNPLSVVIDPDAQKPTREDMKWAFVTEVLNEDAFRAQFPDASLEGFSADHTYNMWRSDQTIRIAEYWYKEPTTRTLALFSDGSTRYVDEISPEEVMALEGYGLTVVREREVKSHRVKWARATGVEILDEGEWEGKFIPLIPVLGEEIEVGDETFRHGLIHHAKDSQRAYNFASSAMLEHIASQPKAPFMATAKQIKNYKSDWEGLNTGNPPVLLYDADPEAGGPPARSQPPTMPAAWMQLAQIADGDMKATTGIYDASLGQRSNETSGRAIMARDQQGETSTFVYMDNLTAAIGQCGKILIDLIPQIYSDERVIRILGEDDSIEGYAQINTRLPDGTVFNDISAGQFDLEVSTGPSYATKRMEAADSMMQFMQANPSMAGMISDLIAKNMDWPGADKIAERLKRALPQGIDPEVDQERGQQIPAEVQQQLQMGQQAIEQLQGQLQQLQQDKSLEFEKLRIDAHKAETDRLKAVTEKDFPLGPEAMEQLAPLVAQMVRDTMSSPDILRQ